MTLFTRCLSFDLLGKIWDMIFLHDMSEDFVLEVALQVLLCLKSQLMQLEESEEIVKLLKKGRVSEMDE